MSNTDWTEEDEQAYQSMFRTPEQVKELEREQQESEVSTYALWERVGIYNTHNYGIITDLASSGAYRVEGEFGHVDFYRKRDLRKVEQLPPAQEMTFRDTNYKVGDIVAYHGYSYRVISTDYISPVEAADAEDANDVYGIEGSYAKAELVS